MKSGFDIQIPAEAGEAELNRILFALLNRQGVMQLACYLESTDTPLLDPFRAALHRVLNEGLVQPTSYLRGREERALLALTAKLSADLATHATPASTN